MGTLRENWLFMVIPIVVTLVGGVISSKFTLAPRIRAMVQHFTAGVVFAAIAGEVIPDVIDRDSPVTTVIGFMIGVALMFGISRATQGLEPKADPDPAAATEAGRGGPRRFPLTMVVAVAIDGLIDGLVIGIGFSVGSTVGTLITVALSLEMFFLGLATAATLRSTGSPPRQAMVVTAAAAATIAVGGVLGATVFGKLSNAGVTGVLAFGCAALLYLVTEELLLEAHTVPETRLISSLFFTGFLTLLVIEMSI